MLCGWTFRVEWGQVLRDRTVVQELVGTSKITPPGTLGSAIQVLRKTVNTFSFGRPWYSLSTPFPHSSLDSFRTRALAPRRELFPSEDAVPQKDALEVEAPGGNPRSC